MPDTTKMFPTDLSQETPADSHHILADDGTAAYDMLISALAAYILGTHTETIDGAVQTVLAAIAAKYSKPGTGIPKTDLASGVQDSLDLADTAIQTETDPTVPSWAKASSKPSYDYSEISGTPTIPTKTSDLTNDSGFLTSHQDISGKANVTTVVSKTSADTSQTLAADTFYVWPEMSALTITCPASGMYAFRFTSGSTATTLTMTGITMPDGFTVEASKVYEINVYNGYGVAQSWSVS